MAIKFKIRLAQLCDIQKIYDLSNDELVRKNSTNQEKILWDEHKNWFEKRITQLESPFFVVESEEGELIAQVRFDNKAKTIISTSITKEFRGHRLATDIIKECVKKTDFKEIVAYIKINNIPSYKAFKRAGFAEIQKIELKNEEYFELIFYNKK